MGDRLNGAAPGAHSALITNRTFEIAAFVTPVLLCLMFNQNFLDMKFQFVDVTDKVCNLALDGRIFIKIFTIGLIVIFACRKVVGCLIYAYRQIQICLVCIF